MKVQGAMQTLIYILYILIKISNCVDSSRDYDTILVYDNLTDYMQEWLSWLKVR